MMGAIPHYMKKNPYLLFFLFACLPFAADAANHSCSSCSDCSAKIQSASYGDNVLLTKDASGNSALCIVFSGKSNPMFPSTARAT